MSVAKQADEVLTIEKTQLVKSVEYESLNCKDLEHYRALSKQAVEQPNEFWGRITDDVLTWHKKPLRAVDPELIKNFENLEEAKWFEGGEINACENCVDRWAATQPERIALIEEGDDQEARNTVTYGELKERVCKIANVLKAQGVKAGSRVGICLPAVWQAPAAMLACARLGATHVVVFAGFSAGSLTERLVTTDCTHLITCDIGRRAGKEIDLFTVVIAAVEALKNPAFKVLCFHRRAEFVQCDRDTFELVNLTQEMETASADCPLEHFDSQHPLFILHTSGSTGSPKGLMHRVGPYMSYLAMTMKYTFDITPEDVYACVADVGWITGHSYVTYGPLLSGTCTVLFETLPTFPDAYRYWQMIRKWGVTKFYTTPTATRILASTCDVAKIEPMPSLKLIGSVGEPLTEDAWMWLFKVIGNEKCPIVDTYWQTETGGHVVVSLPGTQKFYPGCAGLPQLGIRSVILDFESKEEITEQNQVGALCVRGPWPGMFRQEPGYNLNKWFGEFPGFYFTGDSAKYVSEDGHMQICGRIDDAINVCGHLFSCREFERSLMESGLLTDAAAVGIDHDIKGQAVVAFAVLKNAEVDSVEIVKKLRAHVRGDIGPIAVIDAIYFIRELPKTRSGKVVRRLLRQAASKQINALLEADTTTLTDATLVQHIIDVVQA